MNASTGSAEACRWSRTVQRHSDAITIAATPEHVYDLVADLARVDELSPEVRRTEWIGEPAVPVAGARVRGHNRWRGFRWSREAVIRVADRGREFAFETVPGRGIKHDATTWRYVFEPIPGPGTRGYRELHVPRARLATSHGRGPRPAGGLGRRDATDTARTQAARRGAAAMTMDRRHTIEVPPPTMRLAAGCTSRWVFKRPLRGST
jgi:polyketide cyclase/dehydrase/lipid transport protein